MSDGSTKYNIDKTKIYWVTGIVIVLFIIMTALGKRNNGRVKEIIVSIQPLQGGSDFIKEADIKTIVKRGFEEDLKDFPVGRVDVARVERVLQQDPFIQKAEAFVDANNALNIKITQKEPLLRVIDENGLNYYLDKTGFQIPPSKYFSARVPVATGAIPPYVVDFLTKKRYALKDLFALTKRIVGDDFLNALVQQIYVNPAGEFTLIPILGDQKILIGSLDHLEDKFSRLRIFYDQALPYEGWNKYETINLKFEGQIVCKRY